MPGYNGHGNDPRDARGHDPRDPRTVDPRNDSRYAADPRNDPRYDPRDAQRDPRDAQRSGSQRSSEPVPQDEEDMSGTWPCRAVKHRFGEAGTAAIQIGVRVRFTGGKFAGKTCIWYSGFSDKGEEITLRGMEALGHRGDDIFNCDGFYDPKIQAAIADAEAVVTYERNNKTGRMTNKVNFINGGDIKMAKDLTPADEVRFRQRMRGVLAQRSGARGAAPVAPANQPPPPRDQRAAPPPNDRQPSQGNPWDEPGGQPPPRDPRGNW